MKKQAFLRGLLGFPLGIAIGYVITILISLSLGTGSYLPCAPSLAERAGSEIGAVVLQTVLSGLLGASFAAASVVWETENWSIAKQTGVYFSISAATMLPIAYLAEWMQHTVAGFLSYLGIFAAVFLVIWTVRSCVWKRKIKKLNQKIGDREKRGGSV